MRISGLAGDSVMRWELWSGRGYHGRIIVLLCQRIVCFRCVEHCSSGSRELCVFPSACLFDHH